MGIRDSQMYVDSPSLLVKTLPEQGWCILPENHARRLREEPDFHFYELADTNFTLPLYLFLHKEDEESLKILVNKYLGWHDKILPAAGADFLWLRYLRFAVFHVSSSHTGEDAEYKQHQKQNSVETVRHNVKEMCIRDRMFRLFFGSKDSIRASATSSVVLFQISITLSYLSELDIRPIL